MKKALALMLTAAMTAALLVGCSGSKPAETTAAAAAAPAATTAAAAQAAPAAPAAPAYPTKDIQIIVPYAPGGGSDNLVRGMIQYLDLDGKTAVPINVEGASGYIGALQAYNTANDGYTILTHNEMDVISYVVSGQAEVDLVGDLEYICDVVTDYNLLCTNPDSGWKTAQEAIDYINANPGKVTVGCTGSNNVNYATTSELLKAMGIFDKVTIVPYDGGAASETALQGNHIQLEVNSLADTNSYIAAGTNIPLAVCSADRIKKYPDIPSTVELGWNVTYTKPRGFFAPKGTSPEALAYLSGKIKDVCGKQEFVDAMANLGFTVDYVDGAKAKERTINWKNELVPVFEAMSK